MNFFFNCSITFSYIRLTYVLIFLILRITLQLKIFVATYKKTLIRYYSFFLKSILYTKNIQESIKNMFPNYQNKKFNKIKYVLVQRNFKITLCECVLDFYKLFSKLIILLNLNKLNMDFSLSYLLNFCNIKGKFQRGDIL